MEQLTISSELREEVEKDFFNKGEESLASICEQSVFTGLDLYGSCTFTFEECLAHNRPEGSEWKEWDKTEDGHGEDMKLDLRYAAVLDKYLRSDEGLHVVTTRNDFGIIESITVTLASV